MKQVVAALIMRKEKEDEILICQRTEHQPLPLKWEFPGGKIEPGEQPAEALRRELEEELGIQAVIGPLVISLQHTYANGNAVELHFYAVKEFSGKIKNRIFRDVRWARRTDLPDYDFLEADLGLVSDISAGKLL
ncbi:MAG: NUDIX domain-containing protein [Acidobacteriia bacterium]|nr:NUDIX domain-containing protein [Terriglobia bacterium]